MLIAMKYMMHWCSCTKVVTYNISYINL